MTELATAFPCKHCGAQIPAPADLAVTKVACAHCGNEQLVADAAKRLAFADKLANRRAEDRASRRLDAWLYVVIGAFVAGLLGYIGWVTYRSMRSSVDPEVAQHELADWVAAQRGCRALSGPQTLRGPARIELDATGCIRARAKAHSDVLSLTAKLVDARGRAVAGPQSGNSVELRACVASAQRLTFVIDFDAGAYADAAVDCGRE